MITRFRACIEEKRWLYKYINTKEIRFFLESKNKKEGTSKLDGSQTNVEERFLYIKNQTSNSSHISTPSLNPPIHWTLDLSQTSLPHNHHTKKKEPQAADNRKNGIYSLKLTEKNKKRERTV